MYIKDDRQIQDKLKKMYPIIWGQVSDELHATSKSISVFSFAADKFDTIGRLKPTHKAMFNVQSQQYFPASVHMIKRNFYYRGQ